MSKVTLTPAEKAQAKEAAKAELARGIKTFKASTEVQDFYRFINENGLRTEASKLVETVLRTIAPPKKKRGRKKQILH